MHVNSSLTSMLKVVEKLAKGAELMAHSLVLMTRRNAKLQAANEAATQRKSHKRKQVQREGVLTAEEGLPCRDSQCAPAVNAHPNTNAPPTK